MPRQRIQVVMDIALLVAAGFFAMTAMGVLPPMGPPDPNPSSAFRVRHNLRWQERTSTSRSAAAELACGFRDRFATVYLLQQFAQERFAGGPILP